MSQLLYARIVENEDTGEYFLKYHYDDREPEERESYGKDIEAIAAELRYYGWARDKVPGGGMKVWIPPKFTEAMDPIATQSIRTMGRARIDTLHNLHIALVLHNTHHPALGCCWGFSYMDVRYSDDGVEKPALTALDPILPLLTGALFEIECIGHFITRNSAIRAGRTLYETIKKQLGNELLELAVNLRVRKELAHGRRAEAG
ncbi:hypothetical protein LCGC14_0858490 [marine sediment metagenome]|uniref:Uncharacterized protein n=1 Tax=marine sediment metagenome TaxID=412755 RepID=A0A0F9PTG8_9ZZZZ